MQKRVSGAGKKAGYKRVTHTAGLVSPDTVEAFVKGWAALGLIVDKRVPVPSPTPE